MTDDAPTPGTYGIGGHLAMVSDRVRVDAYRSALERAVRPGDVVLDLGTGIGIFAVLACELGAGRVYAIEPSAAIEVARQVAADNDVADRIEFVRGLSTKVELPARADVIVADVNGVLPPFGSSIATLIDARERLLAADGTLIPARASIWAAIASSEEQHPAQASAEHRRRYGVDTSAAVPFAVNAWRKRSIAADSLCTPPRRWASLDYATATSERVEGEVGFEVERESDVDGVAMWFDTELVDGVRLSAAPEEPETIYGQAWFPLPERTRVDPGDRIELRAGADPVDDEYVWRWETRITGPDGRPIAEFAQSTVRSMPITLAELRRRESDHRPALSEAGELDREILRLIDGERSLDEIAAEVAGESASGLSAAEALRRVARLSERYGR